MGKRVRLHCPTFRKRGTRVIGVPDLLAVGQESRWFPSRVVWGVSFPFDQVLALASVYPAVENVFDLELRLPIDDVRGGPVVDLGVGRVRKRGVILLKLRNVNHRVNT